MTRIECSGCGYALELPDGLREGGAFTCAHCGLIARNVESARRFRWAEVDPYVRRHGVSRANLWGGIAGSLTWLPVLGVVLAVQGRFDLGLFVALAAPYLLLLAVLKQRRPHLPAMLWATNLWIGLGLYLIYLWLLIVLLPDWAGVLVDRSVVGSASDGDGGGVMPLMFAALGVTWVAVGAGVAWLYRARARRLPRASGTPPALTLALPVLLLLGSLLGALPGCSPSQPHAELHIFSALPFEQALAQSQSEHKLLLVDVTASWCPPCRKMEETTWRDARVAAWIADHALAVQVDADREPATLQMLGIESLPTLIVFQGGRELDRSIGYSDADQLLAWLGAGGAR